MQRERYVQGEHSSLLDAPALEVFEMKTKGTRCGLCNNKCLLTVHKFLDGETFISGNRCEKKQENQMAIKPYLI